MSRILANVTIPYPLGKEFHVDVVAGNKAQAEQSYAELGVSIRLLPSSASSAKGALLRLGHGSSSIQFLSGGILSSRHDHFLSRSFDARL